MTVRVLEGDCRDVLPTLPDASVQCVVTSPPYFGLRDYQLPPSIWGGDATCEHEWDEERVGTEVGKGNWAQGTNGRGETQPGGVAAKREPIRAAATRGFCRRCGAWLGCFGLEPTVDLYVEHAVSVFREVRRVLRDDGVMFLNLGDSYVAGGNGARDAERWPKQSRNNNGDRREHGKKRPGAGLKPKDLIGIPWRVAFALQADGWWLRSEITWCKRAPMPESVTDRPTSATEKIFLLTKSARYFYDAIAVREENSSPEQLAHNLKYAKPYAAYDDRADTSGQPGNVNNVGIHARPGASGRNMRNYWLLGPEPFPSAHFAVFPTTIAERCLKAGTSEKGACAACGAPWTRVMSDGEKVQTGNGRGPNATVNPNRHPGEEHATAFYVLQRETTGWQPSCACSADVVPCVVLDCFGGAGTTGLVADRLGRDAVLIELSPFYCEMERRRITQDAPLFATVQVS